MDEFSENILTYSISNLSLSLLGEKNYEGILIYSSGEIVYELFFKKKIIPEENTIFHILYQTLLNGLIFDKYKKILIDLAAISGGFILKRAN